MNWTSRRQMSLDRLLLAPLLSFNLHLIAPTLYYPETVTGILFNRLVKADRGRRKRLMARATSLVEHGFAVRDMIRCAQCGSPMQFSGAEFRCPRNRDAGAEDCPTTPRDGDALLRAVMSCLIDRLMNDGVTRELVEAADREISRAFHGQAGDASETGGYAGTTRRSRQGSRWFRRLPDTMRT